MSQFPNVRPQPFLFAPVPFSIPSIQGMRSFDPQLPPVGGFTDADLERMMFALRQSGVDPGRLARIQEVRAMRGLNVPTAPADLEAQLLSPKKKSARQQLLDALLVQPQ